MILDAIQGHRACVSERSPSDGNQRFKFFWRDDKRSTTERGTGISFFLIRFFIYLLFSIGTFSSSFLFIHSVLSRVFLETLFGLFSQESIDACTHGRLFCCRVVPAPTAGSRNSREFAVVRRAPTARAVQVAAAAAAAAFGDKRARETSENGGKRDGQSNQKRATEVEHNRHRANEP